MSGRGRLILVVGPSGVGKDSIIAAARERFRGDDRVVFARRVITRPAEEGGEDHIPVSPAEFAECRDAGELVLYWRAHGLDYGLPREYAVALECGRSVVANVSRSVVAEARRHLVPVLVVAISAAPETLAVRLASRGRESAADIDRRLKRAGALAAAEADVVIENDGPLEAAVERFVEVIRTCLLKPVADSGAAGGMQRRDSPGGTS